MLKSSYNNRDPPSRSPAERLCARPAIRRAHERGRPRAGPDPRRLPFARNAPHPHNGRQHPPAGACQAKWWSSPPSACYIVHVWRRCRFASFARTAQQLAIVVRGELEHVVRHDRTAAALPNIRRDEIAACQVRCTDGDWSGYSRSSVSMLRRRGPSLFGSKQCSPPSAHLVAQTPTDDRAARGAGATNATAASARGRRRK
jgi:hypothetical protein